MTTTQITADFSPFTSLQRRSWKGPLTLLVSVLIAVTLLAAAGLKLWRPAEGLEVLDRVVALVEIPVAMGLVLLRRRWWAWLAVSTMFAAFAGHTGFALWRGAASCGCFGAVETPPSFTFALGLGMFAVAGALAWWLAGRVAMFGPIATVAAFGAASGLGFAAANADPLPEDFQGDPTAMLMDSDAMRDIAQAGYGDPIWLIYLYDPKSPTFDAERFEKYRQYETQRADNPDLRVRTVSIRETDELADVPHWAWGEIPMVLYVDHGVVVNRYDAAHIPADPEQVRNETVSRPDPVRQLMALPEMADIAQATEKRPAWLVYVYNPDCHFCLEHLAVMEDYMEQTDNRDAALLVKPVSMHTMRDEHEIPMWSWPGVPTTFLVEAGDITRRYAARQQPNPFDLRDILKMD